MANEVELTVTETTETENAETSPEVTDDTYNVTVTGADIMECEKRAKRRTILAFGAGAGTGIGATFLWFKKVRPVLRDAKERRRQKREEAKAAKRAAKEAAKLDSSEG